MPRLLIVRHGDTFKTGEPTRRIGRRTDLPLVASGGAQSEALGRDFRDQGLASSRLICGPLMRTRETAAIIARVLGAAAPIRIDDRLVEIDHGPDEGALESAVVARIGKEALAAWDTEARPPPGWIVDPSALTALWRAIFNEVAAACFDTIAVTSGGVARFAGVAAEASVTDGWKLRTGAYGVIDCSGPVKITAWNIRPEGSTVAR